VLLFVFHIIIEQQSGDLLEGSYCPKYYLCIHHATVNNNMRDLISLFSSVL
jgi:hypothetical protein